jgi:hypothetical protein
MDEARLDKPREYFAKLLGAPDDGIDFRNPGNDRCRLARCRSAPAGDR